MKEHLNDEVHIEPMPPEQRVKFYAAVGVTVGIVVVGWALSTRDLIRSLTFSPPLSAIEEVTTGVSAISADVKAKTSASLEEFEGAVDAVGTNMKEELDAREEVKEEVAEIMKLEIESMKTVPETTETSETVLETQP
jgi:hypothetical protein